MRYVDKNKWIPVDGIVLEKSADDAVRCETNALVVAGPGAGKTELLAQKAGYLLTTHLCKNPQKILAISFKKDAAENLKKRVIKRFGKEAEYRFVSMTYDAFFKSLLDHFRYALPEESRPENNYCIADQKIIHSALERAGFKIQPNKRSGEIRNIERAVINKVELPLTNQTIGEVAWTNLIKGFDNQQPALSFSMIAMLAKYIVDTNLMIKKAIQATYSYVFLDEFQDTTSLQYSIVKSCFEDSRSVITAVGDNKQRIMLWAGALKTVFEDFEFTFRAEKFQLIMNHRSAPRLVALQREMYDVLQEHSLSVETSSKWNADDGKIQLLISDDEKQEAIKVANSIEQQIANGTATNDICILCKQLVGNYSPYIIEELKNRGIRARDESEYQDLIKESIVEVILDFLLLAYKRKSPDEWLALENFYLMIVGDIEYSRPEQHIQNIERLTEKLNNIRKAEKSITTKKEFEQLLQMIYNFINLDRVKTIFPAYQQGNYMEIILAKFQDLFWIEYELANRNWITAIESFIGLHSIPIMTIHKSKGLEYSAVYFIGLEDSAFWNFRNQPEEERCVFFVAISRAKRFLMFTFSKYRSNLKYPIQRNNSINEFYKLLQKPGMAEIIE